ncbi:MAG: LuxR C-terminal-related transcriptional regulator, partial [Gaiellaceae bacterium]
ERMALQGLAWARALTGRPVDDVCQRFRSTSDSASYISEAPEQIAGLRLAWRGHMAQARTVLTGLLELADERGEAVSYALQRVNLCDVELRAGELDAAERLLDEWGQSAARLVVVPTYERSRALLAAFRGLPDEAERWAAAAIEGGEPIGVRWQVLEALRARGLAALLAHEPERAAESLRAVWEHTRREGIDEPGAFPVAPDLVEALVELGEPDEALQVADRLQEVAKQQEHPWGLATAKRCRALVQLASGQDEAAALEQAADDYGELGLRFDRGRTLLLLGRAQRRGKRWAAARKALEQAAEAFEEIGSSGWAEDARSELGRIAARRPQQEGQLTPSEQRVAELAVEGLSNKEIAQNLVVSVHTVEAHLTHAYAKLGIRSRGQLARRLARAK